MEVVVGTYNNVLFGFTFQLEEIAEGKEAWKFKSLFTDQGHSGCIKTVATGGRYLASGSTDETIRLFDMRKHIEVGTLVQQDGSITSLAFSGTAHMLSGSDDGTICIWKTKSWELEKILKGHKAGINSISIHPSGRLALSVSKDKSIKTWNLLTGRPAYTTNIKEVGELVCWSPKGDSYAIVVGPRVTIYRITGVHDPIVYTNEKYILAMAFVTDTVLLLAGESKNIVLYDFEQKLVLQKFEAHKVRTKSIEVVPHPDNKDELLLFSVASDGSLKVWSLNKDDLEEDAELLASIELPGRPTSLTVKLPPEDIKPKKSAAKKVVEEKEEKVDVIKEVEEEKKIEEKKEEEEEDEEVDDSDEDDEEEDDEDEDDNDEDDDSEGDEEEESTIADTEENDGSVPSPSSSSSEEEEEEEEAEPEPPKKESPKKEIIKSGKRNKKSVSESSISSQDKRKKKKNVPVGD